MKEDILFILVWTDMKFGDFFNILSESQSVNTQFKAKHILFKNPFIKKMG